MYYIWSSHFTMIYYLLITFLFSFFCLSLPWCSFDLPLIKKVYSVSKSCQIDFEYHSQSLRLSPSLSFVQGFLWCVLAVICDHTHKLGSQSKSKALVRLFRCLPPAVNNGSLFSSKSTSVVIATSLYVSLTHFSLKQTSLWWVSQWMTVSCSLAWWSSRRCWALVGICRTAARSKGETSCENCLYDHLVLDWSHTQTDGCTPKTTGP